MSAPTTWRDVANTLAIELSDPTAENYREALGRLRAMARAADDARALRERVEAMPMPESEPDYFPAW